MLSFLPELDGRFSNMWLPFGSGGVSADADNELDQSILRHHPVFLISLVYRF